MDKGNAGGQGGDATVRGAVVELLRGLGMTTVFGNPGSTEIPFLGEWPNSLRYVLGLQEASVVAMADGYARASGRAAFCNLHSAAGVGHALGNLFTAHRNNAPLVITAGQQARELLPLQPFLGWIRKQRADRNFRADISHGHGEARRMKRRRHR